jgi:mono/diheme cytochrome c family protein
MKVLKWIGIVLGGLIGLLLLVALGLGIYGNLKWKPTEANRPLYPITADTSPEGMARGKYLMEQAMLCTEACHTSNDGVKFIGGAEEFTMGPIQVNFARPNLTPDPETGLGGWTDAEIARAIREGVDKDGRALVIMPSYTWHSLSDADVAAVVGYLRSLEPVKNAVPDFSANAVAKIMAAFNMFGQPSRGEVISAAQAAPQPGTPEYGSYMISVGGCRDCHQQNLAGGSLPFSEPGAIPAANLTPAGELAGWTLEQFIQSVTDGVKPTGKELDEGMPRYKMTPEDLADIFAYLKTVPAVQPEQ